MITNRIYHTVLSSYRPRVLQSYSLIVLCIILLSSWQANGQAKNEEVTIIAPYIPSIGNAAKIPFRPEVKPDELKSPTFEYDYVIKRFETRLELNPIEPMKYSDEEKEQLYRNYAKVGMGNYITPYFDFMASSLQSEDYHFGVRLKHHSSQGNIKEYPPSAYSHSLVSVYGRAFTKTHTITADVGYNHDLVHFYGFKPDSFPEIDYTKEDLKQRFHHVHGNLEFGSNYQDKYKLNHRISLGLNYFSDYFETRESQVTLMLGLDKEFKTSSRDFRHSFALDFGFDLFGYKDSITSSHPLFIPIRPIYSLAFGQYRLEFGFKLELAGGGANPDSAFGAAFFPIIRAEVIILEDRLKAFAEITGNRTVNSYRSLAGMNPFIISTPEILYTDEQIKIGGGITGNANGLNFLVDAYYSFINDMPLYVNDTTLPLENRFGVIYDNINLLKVRASLGYVKLDNFSARLQAAYCHYIPADELKAWHMPNFEVGLDAGYTFLEKYTLKASILTLGPKYARTFTDGEIMAKKLKGAFDLGAGFEYRVNRMISAYIDVNNILNQHYMRWNEYPVQGILVIAGAKLSF
jgi:hypothetical protein